MNCLTNGFMGLEDLLIPQSRDFYEFNNSECEKPNTDSLFRETIGLRCLEYYI